jgi:hypothetical protein
MTVMPKEPDRARRDRPCRESHGPGGGELLPASRDGGPGVVATTLPQFFLVGVSWPREMVPPVLDQLRRVSLASRRSISTHF